MIATKYTLLHQKNIDYHVEGRIQDLKKEGAQRVGGSPTQAFLTILGQFRGLFKEFGTKKGGRAPPPLNPRLMSTILRYDYSFNRKQIQNEGS